MGHRLLEHQLGISSARAATVIQPKEPTSYPLSVGVAIRAIDAVDQKQPASLLTAARTASIDMVPLQRIRHAG
jgi:hypothetical protein